METTTPANGSGPNKISWPFFREIGKQALFGSMIFYILVVWMFLAMYLFSAGVFPAWAQVWPLILLIMATISIVVLVVSAFASCQMESMEKMRQFTEVLKRAALNLAIVPVIWRKLVWLFRCCGVH